MAQPSPVSLRCLFLQNKPSLPWWERDVIDTGTGKQDPTVLWSCQNQLCLENISTGFTIFNELRCKSSTSIRNFVALYKEEHLNSREICARPAATSFLADQSTWDIKFQLAEIRIRLCTFHKCISQNCTPSTITKMPCIFSVQLLVHELWFGWWWWSLDQGEIDHPVLPTAGLKNAWDIMPLPWFWAHWHLPKPFRQPLHTVLSCPNQNSAICFCLGY